MESVKAKPKVQNEKKRKRRTVGAEIWRNFKKNKGAMIGLGIIIAVFIVAFAANYIYDYATQVIKVSASDRLQSPSWSHPFGTDQYGRDIMIRILYGARYSLTVGIVAVFIALSIGASLGVIAGYYGGFVDNLIMRMSDVFASIPSILLAICISTAFGQSIFVLMLAVGIVSVPHFCRVARAAVMMVFDQEYIEASRAAAARDWQVIVSHIIPNSLAPIMVQSTMRVAQAIIVAASLSFLGLGVPAPAPEWGGMLSEGRAFIRDYSYMTMFPGLAIMVTVLAINLIGDGLRDAMDPKLKR